MREGLRITWIHVGSGCRNGAAGPFSHYAFRLQFLSHKENLPFSCPRNGRRLNDEVLFSMRYIILLHGGGLIPSLLNSLGKFKVPLAGAIDLLDLALCDKENQVGHRLAEAVEFLIDRPSIPVGISPLRMSRYIDDI